MCNCKPGGDDAARCYPSSLTDEVWSVIEPLLPVRDLGKGGRPRVWPDRLVLDSIFYVLRAGCQWRMVPHDLAPWWVAYRRYRSWAADGTWDTIHDQLRAQIRMAAGRDPDPTAAVLDAQSIKSSEGGEARGPGIRAIMPGGWLCRVRRWGCSLSQVGRVTLVSGPA